MQDIRKEVKAVRSSWRRLVSHLGQHTPRVLRSLQPPHGPSESGLVLKAWRSLHDGQKSSSKPLWNGFRLLSRSKGQYWRRRCRGASYRQDWDDSWAIIASKGTQLFLCYCPHSSWVYQVDVSNRDKYRKHRLIRGLDKLIDSICACLSEGETASIEPVAVAVAVPKPRRGASVAEVLESVQMWLRHNADEGIRLGRPAPASALARAKAELGYPLPAELCELLQLANGESRNSAGLFGSWTLLSITQSIREYRLGMKLAEEQTEHWRSSWWPLAGDGAGNFMVIDRTGAVIEVCHDPYHRQKRASALRIWLREKTIALIQGDFL